MAKTAEKELKELKKLIREFMESIEYVPIRAVDCNQTVVYKLWDKLIESIK